MSICLLITRLHRPYFCQQLSRDPSEGTFFSLTPNSWCFFQHQLSDSLTPSWCPRIQFSSHANYPELAQTLQVNGSVPLDTSHKHQVATHFSGWLAGYSSGVPTNPRSFNIH